MKTKHSILLAALLMGAPGLALAQSNGFYAGAGVGGNYTLDSSIKGSTIDTEAEYDAGWVGNVFFGYAYGSGFRSELEVNRRANDVDSVRGSTAGTGEATSWGVMANVYYDFKNSTAFTPYVGVGIGGAMVDFDGISPVGGSRIDDSDTALAYQGMIGVSYRLNDRVNLFGDLRHFATREPSFSTVNNRGVDGEYRNNSVMVGFRWSFGEPAKPMAQPVAAAAPAPAPAPAPAAAPPAPPPAPAVARNYLVFFDFDRSNLTPEALAIVRTAASNAPKAGVVRLRVTGHADRAGTDAYNQRLSQRRADTVKAELVRQGISANDISVFARGESQPLVPTADGVREPQNRRVEIVFD